MNDNFHFWNISAKTYMFRLKSLAFVFLKTLKCLDFYLPNGINSLIKILSDQKITSDLSKCEYDSSGLIKFSSNSDHW